ncbi:penicillin-binding protein 2 [Candidatus Enterovibrio altilux]|uniref:Peptidoglycan D,D-transpeptidase MrdA n=1 Tax=Candidatus Enterovibrio altilux TaxID=1927128 RepID=A0A291BA70_9GAMM|nr:penicillin-binding protein 2 [Candidatus Enterovibrio luxaltus]ATF09883.1 Penicillin-binding protein 2 (PBP-2) [Candidatus Enterovibrio luxaltus]
MKHKRSPIRNHHAESYIFSRRAVVAFCGIFVFICSLLFNLYILQVEDHDNYITRSDDNRIKVVSVTPNRGLIYDRNGKLLAENRPVYALEITPEQVKKIPETIAKLQEILPISKREIAAFERDKKRSRRFNSVTLKNQLTEEAVAVFSANQHKFPGVEIKGYLKRFYPYGDALTHVMGYVAKINNKDILRLERDELINNYKATRDIGKLGIERFYEKSLHGTVGYQEVEVNSQGRIIRTLKYLPPKSGKDLVLNLDIDLQLYICKILGTRRGAVVVLDPQDSSVLAMVSSPSYDPNLFIHGISNTEYHKLLSDKNRPLVNRATLGIYPPASTVKPFIAVAALEEKVVTINTIRNDPGFWYLPNSKTRPFRDWLAWGHGHVNLKQALEESVDTFFYQIAYDMGIDRLSGWMSRFGFGDYTGIDIHEESKANMPTREWKMARYRKPWYQGDTIPVGIGQGYWSSTPMQLAKATAVLVNKGKVNPPHLLMHTINEGVQEEVTFPSYPPIQNVSDQHWVAVLEGMKLVNHGKKGTARRAFIKTPYLTGGKSGTAQIFGLDENQKYNADKLAKHLHDHALYTGFAPYNNPQAVVSMVLENAGSGSSQGGPIARKIFDYLLLKKGKTSEEQFQ